MFYWSSKCQMWLLTVVWPYAKSHTHGPLCHPFLPSYDSSPESVCLCSLSVPSGTWYFPSPQFWLLFVGGAYFTILEVEPLQLQYPLLRSMPRRTPTALAQPSTVMDAQADSNSPSTQTTQSRALSPICLCGGKASGRRYLHILDVNLVREEEETRIAQLRGGWVRAGVGTHAGMGLCSLHQGSSRIAMVQEGSCAHREFVVPDCTETGCNFLVSFFPHTFDRMWTRRSMVGRVGHGGERTDMGLLLFLWTREGYSSDGRFKFSLQGCFSEDWRWRSGRNVLELHVCGFGVLGGSWYHWHTNQRERDDFSLGWSL